MTNADLEISAGIVTSKEFSVIIERMVIDLGCSHWDALMLYADKHGIELETIASLVKGSQTLKQKVAANLEDLKMLKDVGSKLPI